MEEANGNVSPGRDGEPEESPSITSVSISNSHWWAISEMLGTAATCFAYPSHSTQERRKIHYCLDFTVQETEAERS